ERVKLSEGVKETLGDGRVIRLDGKYLSNYDGCNRHEKEWRHIAQRPWLAGGIIWSGIEYWGESAGWPVVTSQFGVMDLCRFPKDPYYYYLQEWTEEPMVHILPHWTWPGKEGRTINVWCYSNCDSVELFLNGKSLGVQPRKPLSHIEWKVPYEAGELTAVGVRNSKEVCRDIQKTAGKPFEISLEADRTKIRADGKDLSFVTVRIMDANGVMVPTADDVVTFKVTGNGRLLGVCNGDPASHANPRADEINAFNGMALAIVQSSGGEGVISLLAESNTLRSAKVDIISENHGGS
ncbi:MAG: DUF4982 domain-containing protein, partial [Sedimentisphaerales bacterium]|nr:DUF4982 domain-containing protein [Sedimentisphaerales bacterium]